MAKLVLFVNWLTYCIIDLQYFHGDNYSLLKYVVELNGISCVAISV